jgi:hypothetical protein
MRTSTLLIALSILTFPTVSFAQNCILFPPGNLSLSEITSCSAKLSWTPGSTAFYAVAYKPTSSSQWSNAYKVGPATSFLFTNLQPNISYDFQLTAKCTDNSIVKKKITASTLLCTLPDDVNITELNSHAVTIKVTNDCSYNKLKARYRTLSGPWTNLTFTPAPSYTIDGLNSDSTYIFQFTTCPASANQWTLPDTFKLQGIPNIILILIDDSRYD